jgi:ABC-type uncharacterized transport system involved in gliding motility auxiliary subunit
MAGGKNMKLQFTRGAKEGTTTFLDVLLLLGIFVLIQYLVYAHPMQWDFTPNKEFSLSDLSKKVLANLKQNLELWAFVARGDQQTRDLVQEYQTASSYVKVHFVDPNAEPTKAREFGITSPPPVVVVVYGKNREQVNQPDESKITNAINRLLTGKTRTVYFLQGHGEGNIDATDATGFSILRQVLQGENFVVKTLSLIQQKTIPSDASAIVILDPHYPFFTKEEKTLVDYVNNGGRIFFAVGVGTPEKDFDLLKAFGIVPQNDLVTDPAISIVGGGPEFLLVNNYGQSPITQPFTQSTTPPPIILPLARSFAIQEVPKGETVAPLVSTTTSGAAFPLSVEGKKALINFKKPLQKGVIPVAETAVLQKGGRLVVIGSSFFANNQWINNYPNNEDFILNAISWLTESTDTIAIHPKNEKFPPLVLDQRSFLQLYFLSVIALPGFGIVLGISNWLRRKSL